jgi:RNA 2',3'-cyclic 3'-phosphodiesterase
MEKMIRAFIAFDLPEPLLTALEKGQAELGKQMHHLKPVRAQSIHLTVRFLGEIPAEKVYKVGAAIEKACGHLRPFELTCKGIGGFPDLKSPKVVWAGLTGAERELAQVHVAVSAELKKIGFPIEKKPFSPHLTLFRIKSQKQLGALRKRATSMADRKFGKFTCDTLVLYQSELKPEGAVYTKLKMVGLD